MTDTLTPSILDAFRTHAASGAWFSAEDMKLALGHIDVLTAAVEGTLAELSESPLPGARYAYAVVKGRFAAYLEEPHDA